MALSLLATLLVGLAPSAEAIAPGPVATTYRSFAEIPARGFYSLDSFVTVLSDEGQTDYMWAQQLRFAKGDQAYVGLQSNGVIDGSRVGKMAIFSVYSGVAGHGSTCDAFTGEGSGFSCRIPYEWVEGREYRLRVHEVCCAEQPAQEERWGAWVLDTVTGTETLIGSITVPGSWGWIESSTTAFTSYFGDLTDCNEMPYAKARFGDLTGDSGRYAAHTDRTETLSACRGVARAWCPTRACYHETGVAPPTGPGGPVVLLGIDAEEDGPGAHGPVENYAQVVTDILSKARGGAGILVVGGGKDPDDDVTSFWKAVIGPIGEELSFVKGRNISLVDFDAYRMVAVASSAAEVGSDSSGLTDTENGFLAKRRREVARFVNGGGGLLGLTQTGLAEPYTYLADLGSFSFHRDLDYEDVDPTPEGRGIGVDNRLDVCCWHDDFTEWPSFLKVLATNAWDVGHEDHAAALGGVSVVIAPPKPTRYRFLHFNMGGAAWEGGRTDKVIEAIRRSIQSSGARPAVVSLNEVCRPQFARLLARLDEYAMAGRFVTAELSAKNCKYKPYGNAILVARRYWTEQKAIVEPLPPIHAGYEEGSWQGEQRNLACVRARFTLVTLVCTTHIDYKSRDVIRKQIARVARVLRANDEPVVLMGDFNAEPQAPALDPIYAPVYGGNSTGRFLEVDSFDDDGNPCRRSTCGSLTTDHKKIDYIFLSEAHWTSLGARVTDATTESDHWILRGSGVLGPPSG